MVLTPLCSIRALFIHHIWGRAPTTATDLFLVVPSASGNTLGQQQFSIQTDRCVIPYSMIATIVASHWCCICCRCRTSRGRRILANYCQGRQNGNGCRVAGRRGLDSFFIPPSLAVFFFTIDSSWNVIGGGFQPTASY